MDDWYEQDLEARAEDILYTARVASALVLWFIVMCVLFYSVI